MNAKALSAKWAARDELYRLNRAHGQPLTERMAAAVREARLLEVRELPTNEQPKAYAEWVRWSPPEIA